MRLVFWKTQAPAGSKLAELRAKYDQMIEAEEKMEMTPGYRTDPERDFSWALEAGELLGDIAEEEQVVFGRRDSVDFEGKVMKTPPKRIPR